MRTELCPLHKFVVPETESVGVAVTTMATVLVEVHVPPLEPVKV